MASPLKNRDEIEDFQDWMDNNHEGWVPGGELDGGKGYGNFGPSTSRAWRKYGEEYRNDDGWLSAIGKGIADWGKEKYRWITEYGPNLVKLYNMWDTELYPSNKRPFGRYNNPQNDAWNHMVMSALSTELFGAGFATIIGQAQEFWGTIRKTYRLGEWKGTSDWLQDTKNNWLGMKIGLAGGGFKVYRQKAIENVKSGNYYDKNGNLVKDRIKTESIKRMRTLMGLTNKGNIL